jgi:hypothetical protein
MLCIALGIWSLLICVDATLKNCSDPVYFQLEMKLCGQITIFVVPVSLYYVCNGP